MSIGPFTSGDTTVLKQKLQFSVAFASLFNRQSSNSHKSDYVRGYLNASASHVDGCQFLFLKEAMLD